MQLSDMMDMDLLTEMILKGYVRSKPHPTESLVIYNYSEKAQHEGVWNEVTRQCRGLIVSLGGHVVARPFPKFFNLGQPEVGELPDEPFDVLEKMDGSLGILYPTSEGYAIATRGSFTSDQALHATQVLQDRYAGFEPMPGATYVFEIIYPANRIVLDYKGLDDLVLLDVLSNETGRSCIDPCWYGLRVPTHPHTTDLTKERPNAEGYVLRYSSGLRVKVKHAEYVRLHAIMTNLSNRTLWAAVASGQTWNEILEIVPDELHPWADTVIDGLYDTAATLRQTVESEYGRIAALAPDRKTFAAGVLAQGRCNASLLFSMYDGKDIEPVIWKLVKPETIEYPFNNSEDNA